MKPKNLETIALLFTAIGFPLLFLITTVEMILPADMLVLSVESKWTPTIELLKIISAMVWSYGVGAWAMCQTIKRREKKQHEQQT